MKNVIYFSVRHPISVLMIFLALSLLGIISLFRIGIDYMPKIGDRKIHVVTEYNGITAAEIRRVVSIPLERSLSSIKSLKNMESVCRTGISIITLNFKYKTDINLAIIECRQILDETFPLLPSLCGKPAVYKSHGDVKPTVSIACIPKDGNLAEARHFCEVDVASQLQRLENVGEVKTLGGEEEEIKISLDKSALESRQITLNDVAVILTEANYEYPAGTIYEGNKELILKTMGRFENLTEIEEYCLFYNNGNILKVGDIAEVSRGIKDRDSFFMHNGDRGIKIDVFSKSNSDPVKTAREVKKLLEKLSSSYSKHFDFTVISDESGKIKASLLNVIFSGLMGMIVTAMVIFLVFRKIAFSGIISLIIPCSFLFSVTCLFALGKTLNLMSLSGLAIGVGLVVDGSTVALENILRKCRHCQVSPKIITEGTYEVLLSNTASMLTTNIVFLPVFLISGVVSELFADMAISIISAITFSALASFTLLPALFSLIDKKTFRTEKEVPFLHSLTKRYETILTRLFDFSLFAPTALIGCCVLGIIVFTLLPKEFMEQGKSERMEIEIHFPANSSLEAIMKKCDFLHKKLNEAALKNINFQCGFKKNDVQSLADYAFRRENVRLSFDFTEKNRKKVLFETEKIFREANLAHTVMEEKDFLSSVLDLSDFSVIVFGKDEKSARLNALKCATDGEIRPDEISTNYAFAPDRIFMTRLNLDNSFSATAIRPITEGIEITAFYEKSVQIPMKVQLAETPQSGTVLENFFAKVGDGILLPIKFLGKISTVTNENILYRFNQKDGRLISAEKFTPDDHTEFTDLKKENFNDLFRDSAFLLAAVVVFLYLILAAQFESFFLPVLLLFAIPPAFFGAFSFLLLSGKTVNVNVCIALIILFGTSVNNSILLYESCKNSEAVNKKQIISACTEKFRAIFVTNATSILALSPFAFNFTGNNTQTSLALSVMGGLITSTLIVLLIIPGLFSAKTVKKENH